MDPIALCNKPAKYELLLYSPEFMVEPGNLAGIE